MAAQSESEKSLSEKSLSEKSLPDEEEHFRPIGTIAILAAFVLTLILLWLSVYVILISRGVTG